MKKIILVLFMIASFIVIDRVSALSYNPGDVINVNDDSYYVVSDGGEYVVALKAKPLLYSEVSTLLSQTEVEAQINNDNKDNQKNDGFLRMSYLYSDNCQSNGFIMGCSMDYETSSIKQIIDIWKNNKFQNNELVEVEVENFGNYDARLLTIEEVGQIDSSINIDSNLQPINVEWLKADTGFWVYSNRIHEEIASVTSINTGGKTEKLYVYALSSVRPVINVNKSAIKLADDTVVANDDNKTINESSKVNVEDTLLQKSLVATIIGLILIGLGITGYLVGMKLSLKKSK